MLLLTTASRLSAAEPDAAAPQLPPGIVPDCYMRASPDEEPDGKSRKRKRAKCQEIGDLDGDKRPDTVLQVSRGGKLGLAILWGSGRPATVIGAGERLRIVEFGDTERNTPRSKGRAGREMSDLSGLAWDLLRAERNEKGLLALRNSFRAPAMYFDFLPALKGDGIRLNGSDAAEVLYLSAGGEWYHVPLGY